MRIKLNNKEINVASKDNLKDLLCSLGFKKGVAVFINDKQLLISEYDKYIISEGDKIRIIKPLGGG